MQQEPMGKSFWCNALLNLLAMVAGDMGSPPWQPMWCPRPRVLMMIEYTIQEKNQVKIPCTRTSRTSWWKWNGKPMPCNIRPSRKLRNSRRCAITTRRQILKNVVELLRRRSRTHIAMLAEERWDIGPRSALRDVSSLSNKPSWWSMTRARRRSLDVQKVPAEVLMWSEVQELCHPPWPGCQRRPTSGICWFHYVQIQGAKHRRSARYTWRCRARMRWRDMKFCGISMNLVPQWF